MPATATLEDVENASVPRQLHYLRLHQADTMSGMLWPFLVEFLPAFVDEARKRLAGLGIHWRTMQPQVRLTMEDRRVVIQTEGGLFYALCDVNESDREVYITTGRMGDDRTRTVVYNFMAFRVGYNTMPCSPIHRYTGRLFAVSNYETKKMRRLLRDDDAMGM